MEPPPVTLSPAAAEAVQRGLAEYGEEGDGLRISAVQFGGGPQYALDFGRELPGDVVWQVSGLTVMVGPESVDLLRGVTVDIEDGGYRFIRPER